MSFFSKLKSKVTKAKDDVPASKITSQSNMDNQPPSLPPPPSSPLLKKAWRKYKSLPSKEEWPPKLDEELLDQISKYEESVNILFVGQIQSGKSSTINSLMSIVNKRLTERSKAGQSEKSLTVQLKSIPGKKELKNITFFDLMGLELSDKQGLQIEDVLSATKGQIVDGTVLNPVEVHVQKAEDSALKIHCVMYIADGENIQQGMAKDFKTKITKIEERLNIGPNRVVVVTKVDNICEEVKNDIRNIFHSRKVETAAKNAAKYYGVTLNKVYPVQNYVDAVELDQYTNIPLLFALRAAVELGIDFIEGQQFDNQKSKDKSKDESKDKSKDESKDKSKDENKDQNMEQ